ncbi:hypothetical protein AVEN_241783-1 [Araneus ventricosus]|uniref:Uncharacterized protein n=1 Tax=Araneus ventricosus TaxID=182803 RepID=A0A4Y2S7T7_ARAVE|nr:hypothetical protein AVEN_200134-1 [Araneus ventricosus]GBN84318.1 hypothetical protein AVEN_241783-1 [Araneus ventricosus]
MEGRAWLYEPDWLPGDCRVWPAEYLKFEIKEPDEEKMGGNDYFSEKRRTWKTNAPLGSVEVKVQGKIRNIEKRLSELENRLHKHLECLSSGLKIFSPELKHSRPTVKLLTFDRQASWSVFKTQFDVAYSTNGWTDRVQASQLVASLRGYAAEILQGIPSVKLTDLTIIEKRSRIPV